jgi:hypothetical protein
MAKIVEQIKEYILLHGSWCGDTALADRVNAKIEEGWKLYGSPFHGGNGTYSCQAMVKVEEVEE